MERLWKALWIAGAAAIVGVLVFGPFFAINKAHAAPTVENRDECAVFADMSLAARALFEAGLTQTQVAQLIAVMYVIQNERQAHLAQLIVVHAKHSTQHPRESAMEFYKTCVSTQGNVDEILGKTL